MKLHTSKIFNQEIETLKQMMLSMGYFCESQILKALEVFKSSDNQLANEIIAADDNMNEFRDKIEMECISIIARRQPVADDLRLLISFIKIASEFERIGDYASYISKRSNLHQSQHLKQVDDLIMAMAKACREMLAKAIDALLAMDRETAIQVWHMDDDVDKLFFKTLNCLKNLKPSHDFTIERLSHILYIARSFERIGDHVTNVAEDIYYACVGKTYLSKQTRLFSDTMKASA